MADNIRNFNDYRKKVNQSAHETEEIQIEIQDPLDFLSTSEREEYYRTQHEAMDAEREKIGKNSPEYYFDEEASARGKDNVEQDVPSGDSIAEESIKPSKVSVKKSNSEKPKKPSKNKKEKTRRKAEIEDEEWFDEDEGEEGGVNPYVIVRIASAITGIFILIILGMIFKAKVYDVYLRPDPDEITNEVSVGLMEGYTYLEDTVTTTADLNLRNTPSTASDEFIVTKVPEGTVLKRVAVSDDGLWAQVEYEGQLLYCSMKYLTVN